MTKEKIAEASFQKTFHFSQENIYIGDGMKNICIRLRLERLTFDFLNLEFSYWLS